MIVVVVRGSSGDNQFYRIVFFHTFLPSFPQKCGAGAFPQRDFSTPPDSRLRLSGFCCLAHSVILCLCSVLLCSTLGTAYSAGFTSFAFLLLFQFSEMIEPMSHAASALTVKMGKSLFLRKLVAFRGLTFDSCFRHILES
jgi:hypothetical protein